MPLIFCLVSILTEFRPFFNRQKLQSVLYLHRGVHQPPALCDRYLSSGSPLHRLLFACEIPCLVGKWDADKVAPAPDPPITRGV